MNQQVPVNTTQYIAPSTPGSGTFGTTWQIKNSAGTVIASGTASGGTGTASGGYNVTAQSGPTGPLSVTVPTGATVGTNYTAIMAASVANDVATFDIVAGDFQIPAGSSLELLNPIGAPAPTAYVVKNGAGATLAAGSIGTANNGYNAVAASNSGYNGVTFTVPAGTSAGTAFTLALSGSAPFTYTYDVVASPPITPAGVTATASPGLSVSFNATNTGSQPSGTTYNLLRGTTSGGENATPVVTGIASLPYAFAESAAGQYYYELTATNSGTTSAASAEVACYAFAQESSASNTATATPQGAPPGAVSALTITLADSGTAPNPTLTWTLPTSGAAVTGLNVRRGTAAGGESTTPLNGSPLAAGATSYVDTTAAYATNYYYVVDALDASGATTSAEAHVKTDTAAPTSLTAVAGNGQVSLSWTNPTGSLETLVQRSPHGAGTWAQVGTAGTGSTSYVDTSPSNGLTYDYRVLGVD